jgi:hypothetical protein
MVKADWSRRFHEPVPMPDGSTQDKSPAWQRSSRPVEGLQTTRPYVWGAASFFSALYGEDDQRTGERGWTQAVRSLDGT